VVLAPEQAIIDVRGLVHDYPVGETAINALRGVSFSVRPGELVAIMGPSGSGKSTLMHLIGCLDTPTSGTVHIAGEDVSKLSETELAIVRNRRIGFVFQRFNLIPRISILDNVTTPLLYAGVSPRTRKERAAESRIRGAASAPFGPAVRRPAAAGGYCPGVGYRSHHHTGR